MDVVGYVAREDSGIDQEEAKRLGATLHRLLNAKRLNPEAIVEEAASPTSLIHNYFEWDDASAAHEYRLRQARFYMKNVEILVTKSPGAKPQSIAFVSIAVRGAETAAKENRCKDCGEVHDPDEPHGDGESGQTEGTGSRTPAGRRRRKAAPARPTYVRVSKVLDDPTQREAVRQKALQELRNWTAKYRSMGFEEFAFVFEVVDTLGK